MADSLGLETKSSHSLPSYGQIPGIPTGNWRLVKGNAVKIAPGQFFTLACFQLLGQPRGRSIYVWAGWTATALEIESEAASLESRENRVKPWRFGFLPGCLGVKYGSYYEFAFQKAAWLRAKAKTASPDWDSFARVLDGWQKRKAKTHYGREKLVEWPALKAKRETKGYVDLAGRELPDLACQGREEREELIDRLLSMPGRVCYKTTLPRKASLSSLAPETG